MNTRGRIRQSLLTVTAILGSVAVGSPAFALSVDFTDGSWNPAQGVSAFATPPSHIDLSASGGVLTVNYAGGPSGDNSGMDGLGINDDEIGGGEQLRVAFSTPVTLNYVSLTDLYSHEGPTGQPESGSYSLNGGAFTSFTSVGGANGALTLNISQPGISSIVFQANTNSWSDYSVRGLSYQTQAVPEPSSLLLLGSGLVGLAAWYRKRAA